MASVADDPNGRKRILFVADDGSRKSIRLGKCDRKSADAICRHVEALQSAKDNGQPLRRETGAWLATVSEKVKKRLAAVGLIDPPSRAILSEFLRDYILNRPDVKPATLEVWEQPCRNMKEFFGENKLLREITAGDCEQFKSWLMTKKLATATIAKRLSFARTFFHTARKHKLIDENPFAEIKIPTANVALRQRFVDRETIQRILDFANPTWRTIIALSRFGGLRCPSEVLSLEWRHIDWERNRIIVPSPKTERYEGKDSRVLPLFPELRPFLEEARELSAEGQTHVVGGDYLSKANKPNGWRSCNLGTNFKKIIKRAGFKAWPRVFHNLRSSRETELLNDFPPHVVAKWMGHDAKVSLKHYAQTTDEHFDRAIGGAKSGAQGAQNQAQQLDAMNRRDSEDGGINLDLVETCAIPNEMQRDAATEFNGEGGIRYPQETPQKTALLKQSGANSGTLAQLDPVLAWLVEAWPTLPEPIKTAICALVRMNG